MYNENFIGKFIVCGILTIGSYTLGKIVGYREGFKTGSDTGKKFYELSYALCSVNNDIMKEIEKRTNED